MLIKLNIIFLFINHFYFPRFSLAPGITSRNLEWVQREGKWKIKWDFDDFEMWLEEQSGCKGTGQTVAQTFLWTCPTSIPHARFCDYPPLNSFRARFIILELDNFELQQDLFWVASHFLLIIPREALMDRGSFCSMELVKWSIWSWNVEGMTIMSLWNKVSLQFILIESKFLKIYYYILLLYCNYDCILCKLLLIPGDGHS